MNRVRAHTFMSNRLWLHTPLWVRNTSWLRVRLSDYQTKHWVYPTGVSGVWVAGRALVSDLAVARLGPRLPVDTGRHHQSADESTAAAACCSVSQSRERQRVTTARCSCSTTRRTSATAGYPAMPVHWPALTSGGKMRKYAAAGMPVPRGMHEDALIEWVVCVCVSFLLADHD